MDPAEVERAVGLIDGIIQKDAFKAMLDDFAAKNHEVFDPTADENKLEYTVLHQQYQQMLEAHIEGKLVDAAVDLGGFLAALPTYVESAGAHERTGAVIELLRTLDSFVAFKDMMLTAKKALVGGAGVALGGENAQDAVAAVPELEASLALTATLEAGGAADGWVKTADKGWIQTFRKKDPEGGPIDMQRCVAHVKMPAEAFLDIFMTPEKKMDWDKEVAACEIVAGDGYDGEGWVVRQVAKIPLMKPRELLWRWKMVRDHPEPGATTCVIYGEKSDLPVPPGMLRTECRIGNAIVRPNDDGTCRLTMFACMNFHFPSFVWNAMSSGWMIRNVIKMETYYQKQCAQ